MKSFRKVFTSYGLMAGLVFLHIAQCALLVPSLTRARAGLTFTSFSPISKYLFDLSSNFVCSQLGGGDISISICQTPINGNQSNYQQNLMLHAAKLKISFWLDVLLGHLRVCFHLQPSSSILSSTFSLNAWLWRWTLLWMCLLEWCFLIVPPNFQNWKGKRLAAN